MTRPLPVHLNGTTRPYAGNGRKLGYPTANVDTTTDLPDGVYFGFTDLADFKHRPSLIFIGTPTTVGDTGRRLEVHLLDIPDIDYYDLPLRVAIRFFHRPNQTFPSVDALLVAMQADKQAADDWFARAG